jgi:AhpC/TSA family/Thiol:disulfide interchange protein DsbD, N-terminal
VQLQEATKNFKSHDIGLAAISYDSEAILNDFAKRKHITYPLLADPQVDVIQAYNVLNTQVYFPGITKGIAHPGFFYIDPSGKIKEKFFEAAYTERYTANNVVSRLFPALTEQVPRTLTAPHIGLILRQSDETAAPGSRIRLIVEMNLAPNLHVYSPGVKGYIPVDLKLESAPEYKLDQVVYPHSKALYLVPIHEKVPVFSGKFRIVQDLTVSADRSFSRSLGEGKTLSVKGELKYQACDEKVCYTPVGIPVNWQIRVTPLDMERSPAAIQHR